MNSKAWVVGVAFALAAPLVAAQQQPKRDTGPSVSQRLRQHQLYREAMGKAKAMRLGDRQAWLNSLDNQVKLHAKLAEAWQVMGLSAQEAKNVADAYDPNMASQMHHTPMRGKSGEEVAALLQAALASRRYLVANQLLIDYERSRLSLTEMASSDAHEPLGGM